MGGSPSKEIIRHVPDPAMMDALNKMIASSEAKNEQLLKLIADGKQSSEEALKMKDAVTDLKVQQKDLLHQMEMDRRQHDELIQKYAKETRAIQDDLNNAKAELKEHNIDNLDELAEKDRVRFCKILDLCKSLPPFPLGGKNIGFFGNTSVGKSTVVNNAIGKDVCETGVGETTMEMHPYRLENTTLTYWDIPGKNDKVNYLSASYIGTVKSMAFIGVMVQHTIHEMSRTMEVLSYLNLDYHVIVNKVDHVDEDELDAFKAQIRGEVTGNPHCKKVYFISGKRQSGDWLELMNDITSA